jgi:hypothetical protein
MSSHITRSLMQTRVDDLRRVAAAQNAAASERPPRRGLLARLKFGDAVVGRRSVGPAIVRS